jgi:hypothetical protein
MSVFDEMIASQLKGWLDAEITDLESENNGCGSFFAPASWNLNPKDFKRLVSAAKRESKRLGKRAGGCPVNPKYWQKFYAE